MIDLISLPSGLLSLKRVYLQQNNFFLYTDNDCESFLVPDWAYNAFRKPGVSFIWRFLYILLITTSM